MKTFIVIPTYNERDNISRLIPQLFKLSIPNLNILIVDDSSPDKTGQLVKDLAQNNQNIHILERSEKQGLGPAYIAGFQKALALDANQIVQMDADFSHDPNDVPKLLEKLSSHDLVLGSRYSQGISVINWPLSRLLISIAGNVYASLITSLPFKDATGGFKAWRSQTLQSINLDTVQADGYGFQIITTYRAWKAGKKITEVPIIFTERREGQSKMSKKIIWEAIWIVWKLRLGLA